MCVSNMNEEDRPALARGGRLRGLRCARGSAACACPGAASRSCTGTRPETLIGPLTARVLFARVECQVTNQDAGCQPHVWRAAKECQATRRAVARLSGPPELMGGSHAEAESLPLRAARVSSKAQSFRSSSRRHGAQGLSVVPRPGVEPGRQPGTIAEVMKGPAGVGCRIRSRHTEGVPGAIGKPQQKRPPEGAPGAIGKPPARAAARNPCQTISSESRNVDISSMFFIVIWMIFASISSSIVRPVMSGSGLQK